MKADYLTPTRPPLLPMDYVYITHRLRLPLAPLVFLRKAPTSKGRLSVPRIITIQPASAKDGHVRLHYHRRRTGRPDRRNLLGQIYAFYAAIRRWSRPRSEEHTSELQSLMRISYAVFCLTKKNTTLQHTCTIN